jgi:hypothetical protein
MRIGFAKVGRTVILKEGGHKSQHGTEEEPNLLRRLAERNPQVTWVLVGRSDDNLEGWPTNIENPWAELGKKSIYTARMPTKYETPDPVALENHERISDIIAGLDGMVVLWGHHQEKNDGTVVHNANYVKYIIDGLNRLGDNTGGQAPVVHIVCDPRTIIKARDLKWPSGLGGNL